MQNTFHDSLLGKWGEELACKYLRQHNYKLLARNFRHHRYSEIDIIAQKGEELFFIEVKTRASSKYGRPAEAVTPVKQQKIHRCAEYYLQQQGLLAHTPPLSFDVIEIILEGTKLISFVHNQHCF